MEELELEWTEDDLYGVHASPKEPDQWHYIFDLIEAEENFGCFSQKIGFFGHSHIPGFLERRPSGQVDARRGKTLAVKKGCRYLINVGSVGQPRDGDPRACYLVYDADQRVARLRRVSYDISKAHWKMRQEGLPLYLIERLARGE